MKLSFKHPLSSSSTMARGTIHKLPNIILLNGKNLMLHGHTPTWISKSSGEISWLRHGFYLANKIIIKSGWQAASYRSDRMARGKQRGKEKNRRVSIQRSMSIHSKGWR